MYVVGLNAYIAYSELNKNKSAIQTETELSPAYGVSCVFPV